jgi:hypothetical protein
MAFTVTSSGFLAWNEYSNIDFIWVKLFSMITVFIFIIYIYFYLFTISLRAYSVVWVDDSMNSLLAKSNSVNGGYDTPVDDYP